MDKGRRVRYCGALLALFYISNLQKALGVTRAITYGSAIALVHERSGHTLYSGKISWGSGSMGQAVTAQPSTDGFTTLWLVRPSALPQPTPLDPQQPSGHPSSSVGAGAPVKCGNTIVLELVGSQAILRAGESEAPLSPNHEVGASPGMEGWDSRFVVECGEGGDIWRTRAAVKLRNVLLDSYLQASKEHASV